MTITSSLRFLYILVGSGLLCATACQRVKRYWFFHREIVKKWSVGLCFLSFHREVPPSAQTDDIFHYFLWLSSFINQGNALVDEFQDFLIKLGIKPRMHILEISIFWVFTISCHRQTYQIYEQPPQRLQNSYIQSHFWTSKINGIFLIFFCEEY